MSTVGLPFEFNVKGDCENPTETQVSRVAEIVCFVPESFEKACKNEDFEQTGCSGGPVVGHMFRSSSKGANWTLVFKICKAQRFSADGQRRDHRRHSNLPHV